MKVHGDVLVIPDQQHKLLSLFSLFLPLFECLNDQIYKHVYAECKCGFPGVSHTGYKQRLHVDKEPLKPGNTNDPRY